MEEYLVLRFQAPLMAFGAPRVDAYGKVSQLPGLSMLVGLIGNALGYDHSDHGKLLGLQQRVRFGSRLNEAGEQLTDYQTVDLGQNHLVDTGWTTRGKREGRDGGSSIGTHIRFRDYRAGADVTVVLAMRDPHLAPTIDDIARALDAPARPLFIGRKPCLPSAPLLAGRVRADSELDALRSVPAVAKTTVLAQWPSVTGGNQGRNRTVYDRRDWENQIHVGERVVLEGMIALQEESR